MCAEIFGIGFLHQGITAVFLISEDAADSTGRPEVITHGRFDPLLCQGSGYFRWRCALQAAFVDTPSLKLRKFDAAEIENDVRIYAEDVIQVYNQVKNYLQGLFQLDKAYTKDNIYGIVVVLEDAVVSRKKVYEKVYALLEETATISEEEKNYICSHIKVLPLRAIECMILQNTSVLPELKEQLDKPEKWYDYTYTNATVENGLISTYAQYEQAIKGRISKQT